jgi:nitroimidazol reductase NimA-like FMN-containing flavoprotein (pyridoxamine 5'-phosphate oxidase superfamily)
MRTWVEEMTVEECVAHLAAAPVGRIAVMVDGRPEIFPVSHAYEPETGGVVFPSNPRTKLNAALCWPFATFEVDGCDADSGWSVLIVGTAEEVTHDSQILTAMARRHRDWAVSAQTRWLRIRPEKLTGRRILQIP